MAVDPQPIFHTILELPCSAQERYQGLALQRWGCFSILISEMLRRLPPASLMLQIIQVASYTYQSYTFYYEFLLWIFRCKAAPIRNPPVALWEDGAERPVWWWARYCWALGRSWREADLTEDSPHLPPVLQWQQLLLFKAVNLFRKEWG